MKLTIEGKSNEIEKLLNAIGGSKEQSGVSIIDLADRLQANHTKDYRQTH